MKWLEAFLFTQAVEIPIWMLALCRMRPSSLRERPSVLAALLIAFGASAITHPVVWFGFARLTPAIGYWPMVCCAEVFAVAIEAIYMRAEGMKHFVWWSIAANGASFGLGVLILWPLWSTR